VNARAVAIQGGLAFGALVLAYATWQRPSESSSTNAFVLDLTKNDLEKIRFDDQEGKTWSELTRGDERDGSFVFVNLSGYDSSDAGLPSGHPGVVLKMPDRLVRGNESAQRLFERFSPLRATRALGVLDSGKLKELGLDAPKKTLEVTARGVKHKYAIVPAPPGGTEPYLKDLQDSRVYIVDRSILTDMQSARTNLVERRMHGFPIEEIDRVVIEAGGARRELSAGRIEKNYPGIKLAPIDAPDKPDETLKNWHDRVFSLAPTEVLGKGEKPASGVPVTALRLTYSSRGRPLGWMELARPPTDAISPAAGTPAPTEVYARTEFTAEWVRLAPDAQNLLTEGEKLAAKK
jgi:hypothetical protein